MDAVVPGAIGEGNHARDLGPDQIRVFDGGPDGDGETAGDNALLHDAGGVRAVRQTAVSIAASILAACVVVVTPAHGSFPGQNGRIAYEEGSEIRTVNPDGTGVAVLAAPTRWNFAPDWSPDGSKVAFSGDDGTSQQVYVVNADGSGLMQLTGPAGPNLFPGWSPNGQQIAFNHNGELWVMDADGSDQRSVANPPIAGLSPDWSPDGSRIAFEHMSSIHWIRPDGTDLTRVTPPPDDMFDYGDTYPDWSPDGLRIAFIANYDADGEQCYDLVTVGADGNGFDTVRSDGGDVGGGFYAGASWSPDGQRIASVDLSGLFTVRIDGSDYRGSSHSHFGIATVDCSPCPTTTATCPAPT